MRRTAIVIFSLLSLIVLTMCTESPSFFGRWQRNVSDPENQSSGIEVMELNEDSTFHIGSFMTLNESSDDLKCSLKFNVSISGKWRVDRMSISLVPDLASYKCVADTTSFYVDFLKDNKKDSLELIKSNLFRDLTLYMDDYYRDIYSGLSETGIKMDNVVVRSDTLFSTCEETIVYWSKVSH